MANTHIYGFRWKRSIYGGDTPQTITVPVPSGQAFTTGTACNLNIGDPIRLVETTGAVELVTAGNADTTDDVAERTTGVVVGFPQMLIGGGVRPNAFLPTATVYGTAMSPTNLQTLVTFIPCLGNIFEIDCSAAPGSTFDTLAEWQTLVTQTLDFTYSVLGAATVNPKANPLALFSSRSVATAAFRQLRVLGVGSLGNAIDYTASNVTLTVEFNQITQNRLGAGSDGS